MRAIVVRQPYAELIALGIKTIELRTWSTAYRGPLAIVAGRQLHRKRPRYWGSKGDGAQFPRGRVVAVVALIGCVPMKPHHAERACFAHGKDLYAWKFRGVVRVDGPEVKGRLGLFEVAL